MISKDGSLIISGEATIHPLLTEAMFLDSGLGRSTNKGIFNARYNTYHAIGMLADELECSISLIFREGVLNMVRMTPRWSGLTSSAWSNWSLEDELEIKRKNDALLRRSLGPPPYSYEWGNISSEYDAKTGGSEVTLNYDLSPEK